MAADDREGLERLCRYGFRAPLSHRRLSVSPAGNVVYRLRHPWPTPQGVTQLELHPLEFLRRLAVLIPSPYTNLVRYAGVFASRSRYRHLLPPPPKSTAPDAEVSPQPPTLGAAAAPASSTELRQQGAASDSSSSATADSWSQTARDDLSSQAADLDTGPEPESAVQSLEPPPRRSRLKWAQLLKRVFDVDALSCPRCSTAMVILAFISDPPIVAKILAHLKLPTSPPPLAPPRPPDQPDLFVDLPPDELPPETDYLDEPASEPASQSARAPPF